MCGRFSLAQLPETLSEYFGLDAPPLWLEPHYNIAPGHDVAIIRYIADIGRHMDLVRWGLIPSWAKESKIGHRLINARAETVAVKPAFRSALRKRRCLIPADGFYEWQETGNGKQPLWISLPNSTPFAFAGLWEHWESPDGHTVESCTIITTSANAQIHPIHERMPLILPAQDYDTWLSPDTPPATLMKLLTPYNGAMHYWPVSPEVNNPRHDSPSLIQPINQ